LFFLLYLSSLLIIIIITITYYYYTIENVEKLKGKKVFSQKLFEKGKTQEKNILCK